MTAPRRLRVMTLAGTRPELIRLSCLIPKLDRLFEHRFVHTGQNFSPELRDVFYDDLGLRRPDHDLASAQPGDSPCVTIGRVLSSLDPLLAAERWDAFVVLGDTNSALGAYAAKRRGIPIFHLEAGNRCFDERVPEEINRRIIDHLADVHLPYSQIAREYLLREGIAPDRIVVIGSPLDEVLRRQHDRIERSQALSECGVAPGQYLLLSAHREENVDSNERLGVILEAADRIAAERSWKVLFSAHPRTLKRLQGLRNLDAKRWVVHPPFAFSDYVQLQRRAGIVLSDSGTITEEVALLRFPAVNIRDAQERPEGLEHGIVACSGVELEQILSCAELALARTADSWSSVPDYSAPNCSDRVINAILSLHHRVRRH